MSNKSENDDQACSMNNTELSNLFDKVNQQYHHYMHGVSPDILVGDSDETKYPANHQKTEQVRKLRNYDENNSLSTTVVESDTDRINEQNGGKSILFEEDLHGTIGMNINSFDHSLTQSPCPNVYDMYQEPSSFTISPTKREKMDPTNSIRQENSESNVQPDKNIPVIFKSTRSLQSSASSRLISDFNHEDQEKKPVYECDVYDQSTFDRFTIESMVYSLDTISPEDKKIHMNNINSRKHTGKNLRLQHYPVYYFVLIFGLICVCAMASAYTYLVAVDARGIKNSNLPHDTILYSNNLSSNHTIFPSDDEIGDTEDAVTPYTPTPYPTYLVGSTSVPNGDRIEMIKSILISSDVSTDEELLEASNPKYLAFTWIVKFDRTAMNHVIYPEKLIQRFVLISFFYNTNGGEWLNCGNDFKPTHNAEIHMTCVVSGKVKNRWVTETDECSWYGIECNKMGEVTHMKLDKNKLRGNIYTGLSYLSSLQHLDLSSNSIIGDLPNSIGSFVNLQFLDLSENGIVRNIPSQLGLLTNLKYLDLSDNFFTSLPYDMFPSYGQLSKINLARNIICGRLPSSLSNMITLTEVNIQSNFLTGTLPSNIGHLTNLRTLDLSSNNISGTISSDFFSFGMALRSLNLAMNMITGTLPHEFNKLKQLRRLNLWMNHFESTIPESFGSLTMLEVLRVEYNDITGTMPIEICQLKETPYRLTMLSSDCDNNTMRVYCTCCTLCVPGYGST